MKRFFLAPLFLALGLASASADDIKVSEFIFNLGDDWTDVTSGRPMRAAEVKFDAKDVEDDADPVAVFFYFGPGGGGGMQANIDRWKGQFDGGPSSEEKEDLPKGGVLLTLGGTYMESSGGPFSGNKTPREDYTMLAAILPSEQGAVFVKLTAPKAVATEARKAFTKLVTSALEKE